MKTVLCGLDLASTAGLAVIKGEAIETMTWRRPADPREAVKKKREKERKAQEIEAQKRGLILPPDIPDDEKLIPKRDTSKLDPYVTGLIARAFEDFLRSYLIEHGVEYVAIEEPLPTQKNNRNVTTVDLDAQGFGKAITKTQVPTTSQATILRLYGLVFVAAGVCFRLGIPTIFVSQGTWRKAFLGSGASKDAKIKAVEQCRRLKIPITSEDAAEAVGVAWWLRGYLSPQEFRVANDLFNLEPTNRQSIEEGQQP